MDHPGASPVLLPSALVQGFSSILSSTVPPNSTNSSSSNDGLWSPTGPSSLPNPRSRARTDAGPSSSPEDNQEIQHWDLVNSEKVTKLTRGLEEKRSELVHDLIAVDERGAAALREARAAKAQGNVLREQIQNIDARLKDIIDGEEDMRMISKKIVSRSKVAEPTARVNAPTGNELHPIFLDSDSDEDEIQPPRKRRRRNPDPEEERTIVVEQPSQRPDRDQQTPAARKRKQQFQKFVKMIDSHAESNNGRVFARPVAEVWPEHAERYAAETEIPMDLSIIKMRCLNDTYRSEEEVKADIQLLHKNAIAFNGKGSLMDQNARKIRTSLINCLTRLRIFA